MIRIYHGGALLVSYERRDHTPGLSTKEHYTAENHLGHRISGRTHENISMMPDRLIRFFLNYRLLSSMSSFLNFAFVLCSVYLDQTFKHALGMVTHLFKQALYRDLLVCL